MNLVKDIVRSIGEGTLTEAQIKKACNKAKVDYGCTSKTLSRLRRHGVLKRTHGISSTTGRPSWLYEIIMDDGELMTYLETQEAKMKKAIERKKQEESKQLTGDDQWILSMYNQANSAARVMIRAKYPHLFKQEKAPYYYVFGNEMIINTDNDAGPVFIGVYCADKGFEYKCLLVNKEWEAQLSADVNEAGYQQITFRRK